MANYKMACFSGCGCKFVSKRYVQNNLKNQTSYRKKLRFSYMYMHKRVNYCGTWLAIAIRDCGFAKSATYAHNGKECFSLPIHSSINKLTNCDCILEN